MEAVLVELSVELLTLWETRNLLAGLEQKSEGEVIWEEQITFSFYFLSHLQVEKDSAFWLFFQEVASEEIIEVEG